jgi:hypothetical protein
VFSVAKVSPEAWLANSKQCLHLGIVEESFVEFVKASDEGLTAPRMNQAGRRHRYILFAEFLIQNTANCKDLDVIA